MPYNEFRAEGYVLRNELSKVAETRGWDIAALAREAKISYNTVQRLWNYESKGVQFEKILRIALTLGVSLDEIFPIAKQQGE